DASSSLHPKVIMPVIRTLFDAETSHRLAINFMKYGGPFGSKDPKKDTENLEVELFGQILSNPLGVAAGFDKNAEAVDALFGLGFGYVEIGSVTPKPQEGNPKPRFFRLLEDGACINRYGFNSDGHSAVLDNLQARLTSFYKHNKALLPTNHDPSYPFPPQNLNRSLSPHSLLAINLGKNKLSAEDSDEDYLSGVRLFGPYADVLVINVSSPNTPGLRALQGGGRLGTLLGRVVKERDALVVGSDGRRPKVVVKVAPDLGEEQVGDIARAVKESGVDGVIVSNTTIGRPASLKSPLATETGGLSGPPLKPLALSTLRSLRSQLPPLLPIIGCGGISTGSDVLEFVEAGASAVQLYTSFGFNGVGTARKIKDEL
ncbi:hypothetical protein BDY24DRAFT_332438, partial [Mrakia frigida]|uniref:dihydroorotate dehydrogenase 2 n=1 Tax=Mrakia frigida TaxID=29902 RepID=UPI003FCC0203